MSMIEKVARAIWDTYRLTANEDRRFPELADVTWDDLCRLAARDDAPPMVKEAPMLARAEARAAIEALRLGDDRQIPVEQAGGNKLRQYMNEGYHLPVETACAVYDAMIDAALSEGEAGR